MIDRPLLPAEASRAIKQRPSRHRAARDLAQRGLSAQAVEALTALGQPGQHDPVARANIGDTLPDLDHRSRTLMTQNDGERIGKGRVVDGDV